VDFFANLKDSLTNQLNSRFSHYFANINLVISTILDSKLKLSGVTKCSEDFVRSAVAQIKKDEVKNLGMLIKAISNYRKIRSRLIIAISVKVSN
jgi:hypothetical protein